MKVVAGSPRQHAALGPIFLSADVSDIPREIVAVFPKSVPKRLLKKTEVRLREPAVGELYVEIHPDCRPRSVAGRPHSLQIDYRLARTCSGGKFVVLKPVEALDVLVRKGQECSLLIELVPPSEMLRVKFFFWNGECLADDRLGLADGGFELCGLGHCGDCPAVGAVGDSLPRYHIPTGNVRERRVLRERLYAHAYVAVPTEIWVGIGFSLRIDISFRDIRTIEYISRAYGFLRDEIEFPSTLAPFRPCVEDYTFAFRMDIGPEIEFTDIGFQCPGCCGVIYGQTHFFVLHLTDSGKSEVADWQTPGVVETERLPCFRDIAASDIQAIDPVAEFVEIGPEQPVAHQCPGIITVGATPMPLALHSLREHRVCGDVVVPEHIMLPEKSPPVETALLRALFEAFFVRSRTSIRTRR